MGDEISISRKIDGLRTKLNKNIGNYYTQKGRIYLEARLAAIEAINDFHGQVTRRTEIEIIEIRQKLDNKDRDKTSPGFFIDLVFTVLGTPLTRYLLGSNINSFIQERVANRERDLNICNELLRRETVKKLLEKKTKSTMELINALGDDEVIKKASAEIHKSLEKPLQELAAATSYYEKKLENAITTEKYVKFFSPAGKKIHDKVYGDAYKYFSTGEHQDNVTPQQDKVTPIYNVGGSGGNAFLEISQLRNTIGDYYNELLIDDNLWKNMHEFLHEISYEDDALVSLNSFYELQIQNFAKVFPKNFAKDYREFFEAVAWIIYLGDPLYWLHPKEEVELAPIIPEIAIKYKVQRIGRTTAFTVSLNGKESKILDLPRSPGLFVESDLSEYYDWDPHPLVAFQIKSNVPRVFLKYLVERFRIKIIDPSHPSHDPDETFLQYVKSEIQEITGKEKGFGIDGPEPYATLPFPVIMGFPSFGFYNLEFDPIDKASVLLVDGFQKIYSELKNKKNHQVIDLLKNKFKTGDVDLRFALPPLT